MIYVVVDVDDGMSFVNDDDCCFDFVDDLVGCFVVSLSE